MILAAFGAVHGDVSNLRSVLDAIDERGIQTVVCTGDCALGPHPNEAIDLLRTRQIHVVQGDTDRLLSRFVRKRKRIERDLDAQKFAALEQAHRICTSANLEWLAGLPHARTLTVDGETVALFHGTISSATAQLRARDPDEIFRRQREMVPGRVFIFGGGPIEFVRMVDDALFANPGNLVVPEENQARYLVVSTESELLGAEGHSAPLVSMPKHGV